MGSRTRETKDGRGTLITNPSLSATPGV
jgi:hypothetical protein